MQQKYTACTHFLQKLSHENRVTYVTENVWTRTLFIQFSSPPQNEITMYYAWKNFLHNSMRQTKPTSDSDNNTKYEQEMQSKKRFWLTDMQSPYIIHWSITVLLLLFSDIIANAGNTFALARRYKYTECTPPHFFALKV
jgi:hypothetical protein